MGLITGLLGYVALIFVIIIVLILIEKSTPDIGKHWEEDNKRFLEESRKERERDNIRWAKEKKDWTLEDWNEEYKYKDSHDTQKIYWREQLILKRDNYECKFCGCKERDILHAYYKHRSGLQNISISGADYNIFFFITICDNCNFEQITPRNFEQLVGKLFEKMGYSVALTKTTGDQGIDLICINKYTNEKIVVQCKRYKGNVGSHIVRDFYGSLIHSKANKGYIVTTGHFTSDAIDWAKDKPIEFIDREKLIKLFS